MVFHNFLLRKRKVHEVSGWKLFSRWLHQTWFNKTNANALPKRRPKEAQYKKSTWKKAQDEPKKAQRQPSKGGQYESNSRRTGDRTWKGDFWQNKDLKRRAKWAKASPTWHLKATQKDLSSNPRSLGSPKRLMNWFHTRDFTLWRAGSRVALKIWKRQSIH